MPVSSCTDTCPPTVRRRTLVIGRAAGPAELHVARIVSVSVAVAVAHAPARNRHGPVSIGHGAVGCVVSQVARGSTGDLWVVVGVMAVAVAVAVGARGEGGRGRRVQLVGKGSVSVLLEMLWWGRIMVGRVASTRGCWLLLARGGCKGCHGSSALWVPRYAGGSTFCKEKQRRAGRAGK